MYTTVIMLKTETSILHVC